MATTKRTVEVELSTSGLDAQGRPQRIPLIVSEASGSSVALEAPPALEPELEGEHMLINIGPQHPATHGVLRLVLELDGETVVRCIPHIGYLHCGFEKIGEYRTYNQIIPWTDREDYLNSPGNNVAFALSAERLFGVEITERCKVLRVMLMELSRIISHLVWLGTTCIDIGAFTPFLWSFQERERVYRLFENWIGARLTTTFTRVGGMGADIPEGWIDGLQDFVQTFPRTLDEVDAMVTRNGIWVGRTVGLGAMTAAEALNHGLSGAMLRASGVAYDVRRDFPYLDYETYDFDVPVGTAGDVYDRFLVRMEEMRQSVRILEQAIKRLPDGPVNVDDARLILPPKSKATSDMESMIHHFKQVMEGPRPPIGEAYVAVESPKGEKGYYMVSDGTSKPVRWRIRPPSFVNLSAIPKMVEGHLLSDVIAINASIDIVMGEIDR
jgi:NADH-quinone oxidoreductase subunit D